MRVFFLSIRTEMTVLAMAGTEDQGTCFTFLLVVEATSTFNYFRDAIYVGSVRCS